MSPNNDSSTFDDFLDLLRNLIREPSVVGAEDSFFRVLLRELQELGLDLVYYQGVLVARGKDPQGGKRDFSPLRISSCIAHRFFLENL